MTVDRYLIMRMIDQIHQQKWRLKRKEWFLWAQVVGALLLSTVLHLPYFFQFKVQPCNMPGGLNRQKHNRWRVGLFITLSSFSKTTQP